VLAALPKRLHADATIALAWRWTTSYSTPPRARWRRINGHELVALVRAGATFIDGQLGD
jgi:hypothetical protein